MSQSLLLPITQKLESGLKFETTNNHSTSALCLEIACVLLMMNLKTLSVARVM
jgi:hypothetical protein